MQNSFLIGSPGDGANPFLGRVSAAGAVTENGSVSAGDKAILRELAKKYAELAADEVNIERVRRIKDMNGLKEVRPPVWVDEVPWHEMDFDGSLTLKCECEAARVLEQYFRRVQYRWKYFQADMVVENTISVIKVYESTGMGIEIDEQTTSPDPNNPIVSHHYEDQLDTEAKVASLKIPAVTARPEIDKKHLEFVSDILDGILPVRLRGHGVYYCPWDMISQYRGAQVCIEDTLENPELLHATIKKFTEIGISYYDQMQEQELFDWDIQALHCTPPYSGELPAKDFNGKTRYKDMWFRGMAQPFVMVSPAMRDEFDLEYMKPVIAKFGLAYYGCCEPLHKIMPSLKQIPNMRKIGASPWADIPSLAEQIGSGYVMARKPNPASVAMVLNEEALRKEIGETAEVCRANKTPCEFVLKDISTVGKKPENLFNWVKITAGVIDKYYN
ncbi:hypothetical protein AGMMS50212_14520 [Spirochaetia bacterium]|nr:hypothetical protein AGMMS50212_14520 [Spirochaetia bacterium]